MPDQNHVKGPKLWLFRIIAVLVIVLIVLSTAEIGVRVFFTSNSGRGNHGELDSTVEYHEIFGWFMRPNSERRHKTPEFDVLIRINSHGLRADREFAYERIPQRKRVLVIGDSFTFGHGVNNDETLTAFLEEMLTDTEVINLGVSGYGTDQQLLSLQEKGLHYDPDLVILGFYKGDIFRNDKLIFNGLPKPMYTLGAERNLVLTNVPVPRKVLTGQDLTLLERLLRRSQLYRLIQKRTLWLLQHLGYGKTWDITETIIKEMDETVRKAGAHFLVVIYPNEGAIYGNGLARFIQSHTVARMQQLLARNDIANIDLLPLLLDHIKKQPEERLYYRVDGHPTRAWHRLVASILHKHLLSNSIF